MGENDGPSATACVQASDLASIVRSGPGGYPLLSFIESKLDEAAALAELWGIDSGADAGCTLV